MKKIILLFGIVFLSLQSTTAQVLQGTSNASGGGLSGELKFGAKAGIGFSTFSGRDFVDVTPNLGFYAGGVAEIPAFLERFYLQPELLLQLQGADIGSGDLNLWYVQVPLMGKYHITDAFAVEFGPQVGFLISDNWDEALSLIDTEKVNISLNLGGGYRLDETLYFNLRFSPGLTRVIEGTNIKNFVFQIGANYFF